MEWVETTGRTVEEAKETALDRLGVDEADAEFDVVDEPKPGLFGRLRGEARVRARVRPTQARPKAEKRERRRAPKAADATATPAPEADNGSEGEVPKAPAKSRRAAPEAVATPAAGNGGGTPAASTAGPAAEEAAAAAAFLDGLVAAFGSNGRSTIIELGEDEREIRVEGDDLGLLIGPRGQTLQAVQDLTRLAAQPRNGDRHGRLRIDIGGYRQRRQEALARFTERVAAEVLASGASKALEPMSSADR
jgi:spoIIIJ-associated protein